jgi:hypothetical protein
MDDWQSRQLPKASRERGLADVTSIDDCHATHRLIDAQALVVSEMQDAVPALRDAFNTGVA